MIYHSRLKSLNLESLEVRRLRSDLAFAYEILFGVLRINSDTLFKLRNQPLLRGHKYTLMKPRRTGQIRQGFLVEELLIYGIIYQQTQQTLVVCTSICIN